MVERGVGVVRVGGGDLFDQEQGAVGGERGGGPGEQVRGVLVGEPRQLANAFLPEPRLWAVFLCVALDGVATGVSVTALMAVAPSLVRQEQLPAAGALLSLTGEIGSIAAPFLGGVLLALSGPGPVFAATAVTTGATTLLLRRVGPLPPLPQGRDAEAPGGAVGCSGEGAGVGSGRGADDGSLLVAFRHAVRDRVVGGLLVLGGVTALFNLPVVLFPELVATRFGGGEVTLGLLCTAPVVGAVLVSATSSG
ncbi:MFS transporter [Streptomyces silvensis]|uniref:Major facilitator superfamily (MFS) profile domain-containing protein n=1 Tax=Streptomyces silvensis TaxID=1765722 RepID=A0A0W7WSU4_9ACTN|nr:MFS transporter [Streptomyces silvensis]KUF13645.1 hypothetical protein AT728_34965 [Streptomyces silvensis]